MGQEASIPFNTSMASGSPEICARNGIEHSNHKSQNGIEHSNQKSQSIRHLIDYARSNYHENPTESLAALLQALQLNSGSERADCVMGRLRNELGDDIADHIGSRHQRMERALHIIEDLLQDESTILFEGGRQDLLRQTVEDGSSVVCSKCNDVVASTRWKQHQDHWCKTIEQREED